MTCPYCNEEMREGYLYTTKDGAFSFSREVPGMLARASAEPDYVKITTIKTGHRANIKANVCEKCKKLILDY